MTQDSKKALGRILLEQKAIRQEDLDRALAQQVPGSAPLATRLIEQGLLSELEALKALSAQRGVPGIDLNQVCIALRDLDAIPREIALLHKLLPVLDRQDRLFVAMANPGETKAIEELEFVTGKRVFAYIALEGALARSTRDAYDARDRGDTHYVGPACPVDVLRKAGLDPAKYGVVEAPAAPEPAPAPPPARPAPPPAPEPARPAPPSAPAQRPAPKPATPAAAARPLLDRNEPASQRDSFFSLAPAAPPAPAAPAAPPPAAPARASRPVIAEEVAAPVRDRRAEPGGEVRFRPSSHSIPAITTQVVVDDKMQKLVHEEVNEADFGDIERELSVVGELPKEPEPASVATGKTKVLIVDDEADIRRLMRKVLEEKGYEVVEADGGRIALQMMKTEQPHLVVLDAMLPEVHGFDIARRIRGSTRYGHIPIVMVSAVYRGWRVAEDAKSAYGVDAYLEKPFKIQHFIEVIEGALRARAEGPIDPESMNETAERLLKEGVDAYKSGALDRATELLEEGVKIDPLAYRLRFHLGLLYGKRGQVYDAIEQLERAVQIQGRHFATIKNLAILYQQAGFRNRALEAWERALALAPDEETKRAIKEHIVSLL